MVCIMSNAMKLYTIGFEDEKQGKPTNHSIFNFLKRIETVLTDTSDNEFRRINDKLTRVTTFEWSKNNDVVVIPLGVLKRKNRPQILKKDSTCLTDIPDDMYDVNNLVYNKREALLLLTTNHVGPKDSQIEAYLNSYLPTESPIKIKIRPVERKNALEVTRSTKRATKLKITLNVTKPLGRLLNQNVQTHNTLAKTIAMFAKSVRNDLNSNFFTFEVGLGNDRKASLTVTELWALLDSLDLSDECIHEISVKYTDKTTEKLQIANLRKDQLIVQVKFPIQQDKYKPLGAEYIISNLDEVLSKARTTYIEQVQSYWRSPLEKEGDYEFNNIPLEQHRTKVEDFSQVNSD